MKTTDKISLFLWGMCAGATMIYIIIRIMLKD
jgi:hypothetical protein